MRKLVVWIWIALTACSPTPVNTLSTATAPILTPPITATTQPTNPTTLVATATARATPISTIPVATNFTGRFVFNKLDLNIWVMDADGSDPVQVTHAGGNDFDPSWSPDGRQFVFRTSRGQHGPDRTGTGTEGIFIANADGSGERQLYPLNAQTIGGLFPDWSPVGNRIAFSTLNANGVETLHVINADGSGLIDLGVPGEGAKWSPDGKKIAYGSHPGNGDWQVWVVNVDGSNKTQLTRVPARIRGGEGGNRNNVWSPDGKRIAYTSDRDGDYEIYIINADGSGDHRVTHSPGGQSPEVWLPDGRIIFDDWSARRDLPDWYVMNADGTGLASLPQLQGANSPLDWTK